MKIIYFVIVFSISALLSNNLQGQNIRNFSNDSSKYFVELGQFFNQLINKEVQEKSLGELKVLTNHFLKGNLTADEQSGLSIISSEIIKKNLKPYPHLFQMISIVNGYCSGESGNKSDIFILFDGLSTELKKTSTKDFEQTLENIYHLVTRSYLYNSPNLKWANDARNFRLVKEGVLFAGFPESNFYGFSRTDTVRISGSKGTLNLLNQQWNGIGGKVVWSRVGLDTSEVYAKLADYTIELKTGKITANDALLFYHDFFAKPLIGTFEDQVFTYKQPVINFPKFTSATSENHIKNLVTDVDGKGTFKLEGKNIIICGTENETAAMWFRKKHKDLSGFQQLILLKSLSFGFDGSRIVSSDATLSIYHEYDSIFHPSVSMIYYDSSRIATFSRSKENLGICPFIDSYHKIDINAGMIAWDMDLDEMLFTWPPSLKTAHLATFESDRYFSDYLFDQMKGLDNKHPFLALKHISEKLQSRSFNLDDVATYYNMSTVQVQSMIYELAAKGYLIFNFNTKIIILRDRIFSAVAAKSKKMDYDVIRFSSSTEGLPNARLNLRNFELNIDGVSDIRLSDAQEVIIKPSDKRLIFRKNRDFLFSGKIEAGLFDFYSAKCGFSYDSFMIRMPVIDSMLFKVKPFTREEALKSRYVSVKNVIADISGQLFIDSASNKSGLKQLKQFPVFECNREAYVYYDRKSIQNGVYSRDTFYYYLKPFTLDSLLSFQTEGIQFEGRLISGGIFPDIVKPLMVQPDYSLGFVFKTGQKGLPAYENSGTFYDTVFLSNKGLKGKGRLTYLDSEITSDDFTFLPQNVNATARKATLKSSKTKSGEFPSMVAEQLKFEWNPYEDIAYYESKDKKISLFDGKALLEGKLKYTPSGLTASGKLSFSEALLKSNKMNLTQNQILADTSDFSIEALDKSGFAFATQVYKSQIDFSTKTGKFKTNGVISKVEFPVNQFIASMDEFDWLMEKNQINLKNNIAKTIPNIDQLSLFQLIDTDFKGSEFTSTNPEMDSLEFFTVRATYDIKDALIKCEDVKIIHVADAAVFPGDGKVLIGKSGKINPLENAVIITKNKYHRFDNSTVSILSRSMFSGSGNYNYISMDESVQTIKFGKITVDTSGKTVASGYIPEKLKFKLSPKFDFKGEVGIKSSRPFISYNGGVRINSECLGKSDIWVKMNSELNPKNIQIPIDETIKDTANTNVYAAIFYSVINSRIYPSFFSRRNDYTDSLLFNAYGYLSYDYKKQTFNLGFPDSSGTYSGNHLHFDESRCQLNGTGEIKTGVGIKPVEMINYGTIRYFQVTDSVSFQMASSINFYFEPAAFEIMAENISQSEVPFNENFTENYLQLSAKINGNTINPELTTEMMSKKKNPEANMKSLIFSDIVLFWNPKTKSYQSRGPVSLASVLKMPINKTLNGHIEIEKKRGGDILSIYLETDRREWYFFNYSDNLMQSISSETSFNKILRDLGVKERKSGEVTGQTEYRFIISTTRKKNDFLRRIRGNQESDIE